MTLVVFVTELQVYAVERIFLLFFIVLSKIKRPPLSFCGISPMESIMDTFAKILDFLF